MPNKESFEQIAARHKREIAAAVERHQATMLQLAQEHRLQLAEWALSDKPADFVLSALDIIRSPLKHITEPADEPDAQYILRMLDKMESNFLGVQR